MKHWLFTNQITLLGILYSLLKYVQQRSILQASLIRKASLLQISLLNNIRFLCNTLQDKI